jgi:hypothetical protein
MALGMMSLAEVMALAEGMVGMSLVGVMALGMMAL